MLRRRRNVLRVVGGVLAGSLAGCLGSESESTPTNEPSETPGSTDGLQRSGIPEWTSWAPSPAALGLDGGYEVVSFEPAEVASYSEILPSSATNLSTTDLGIDGLGPITDQRRGILLSDGIAALFGPHETDNVRAYLTDWGLERQRTVNGVEIYAFESQDLQDAFGVASDVFIRAGTRSKLGVDTVEAVAAMARDDERLPAAVPDIGTVLALVAPGESVAVRSNTPDIASVDGASAEGYSWRLGTDRTTVSAAFVGDAVGADAVRSWASESERFDSASVAAPADGSAVTATASVQTGDVGSLDPNWATESTEPAPQVQWRATYDADAGHVTIEHRGGDNIDASDLYVRGSGFADAGGADQTAAGPWQGETSDNDGIGAGNTVAVGVTSSYDIRLVYEFPDSDRTATLFSDRGPDA
ncbi:type IV pilin N-terminal domain-containing protein [Haloarcula sp. S1CR25-12]|uniref:Type IV pilin N-terminal domain-containing protein n=1 Tax=Haloarcula saliterrae TaxID=2950534 RepID=A0ABU2FE69_9EURY|nr:hypothetical protein [Haloarcula sp. S1CR25-12]MDS0260030.1 type IV pilin N-terminal domain-containing protein [Haloarcula sp. S1CR25-12]